MAAAASNAASEVGGGHRTVQRIVRLIPILGVAGAVVAYSYHGMDWAEGVLLGSALAWLNFRWMRRGLEAFTSAATRDASGPARGSAAIYLAATFRYVLIGVTVYVIFTYLHIPLLSLVLGLCTLAIAVLTASVWEILQSSIGS